MRTTSKKRWTTKRTTLPAYDIIAIIKPLKKSQNGPRPTIPPETLVFDSFDRIFPINILPDFHLVFETDVVHETTVLRLLYNFKAAAALEAPFSFNFNFRSCQKGGAINSYSEDVNHLF